MNNNVLVGILIGLVVIGGLYFALSDKPDSSPTIVIPQQTNQGNPPTPAPNQNPPTSSTSGDTPTNVSGAAAVTAARKHLAAQLGVAESTITTVKIEERSWSDGCLGLGGPAESCIQMIVDGYRVQLRAGGKVYVYRTDKSGATVRAEAN